LATAFAKILQEFGIADKVSIKTNHDEATPHLQQILSITCDNASCNNVMITELAKILPSFSEVGHTRCFLHIVNLVAKSIIKQFDVQKKREDQHLDNAEQELRGEDAEQELQDLAGDVNLEEQQSIEAMAQHQINGEAGNTDTETETDDDVEGWIDEMMLLSPAEREQVEGDICPVKLVLVKVRYQWCMGRLLLTCIGSFGKLLSKSSTHQQLSCLLGENCSRN
jgi:hypothetical protein